ncbi:MAG: iron-containing alcohol dehydrogenase [Clostridia bacterium]|nr:iron-containing alcohol dehydrogenase [Clostridia bacterium]
MNIASKLFCRVFQRCFHLALPFLPYREPEIHRNTAEVIGILQKNNLRSPLLVTDRGLRAAGVTAALEQSLQESGIRLAVYDGTSANPTVHNVEEALEIYRRQNCDCLIAFGGGSSMDCAKAVGARAVYPKKSVGRMKGLLRVLRKLPPLIAIPTTAGTGSEVTITAVITDSEQKHKYTMNNFTMIPRYAVLDPAVTYTLPPHLTATTGMDALTHAVEAYIGGSTSRQTRHLALHATRLIFENIEIAYRDGTDRTARENLLTAAYEAGIAFSKSYVGYVHAVAHSLGGQYNIPHGLANAVLMPIVLEEYGKSAHKKLHRLAVTAGVADECDPPAVGAEKFIAAIRGLNQRMSIPATLSGIRAADVPQMAKHAAKEANPLYPVPKRMTARELERFYYKVSDGSIQ